MQGSDVQARLSGSTCHPSNRVTVNHLSLSSLLVLCVRFDFDVKVVVVLKIVCSFVQNRHY